MPRPPYSTDQDVLSVMQANTLPLPEVLLNQPEMVDALLYRIERYGDDKKGIDEKMALVPAVEAYLKKLEENEPTIKEELARINKRRDKIRFAVAAGGGFASSIFMKNESIIASSLSMFLIYMGCLLTIPEMTSLPKGTKLGNPTYEEIKQRLRAAMHPPGAR